MLEPTIYRQFLRGYIDSAFTHASGDKMLMLIADLDSDDLRWLQLRYYAVEELGTRRYLVVKGV